VREFVGDSHSLTRCLHFTTGCTTGCMNTAGCTTGWVNYADEPSQAAVWTVDDLALF